MKNVFLLMLVVGLLFGGCGKDEPEPACVVNNTGTVEIYNGEDETFTLWVDNEEYGQIPAFQSVTITHTAGTCVLFLRETHYIILPTEYSDIMQVAQCENKKFFIGK